MALVLLCVNLKWTQGKDNLNLLLCGAMALSPFLLMLRETRVFLPRIDIPLVGVCACVMLFPAIFHPESIRLDTMLFTCAYCVWFMMIARLLRASSMDAGLLCRLIRTVTYAFALFLLAQQICVLAGLPVIGESVHYHNNSWKLGSLTAEPSHTTVTLCALMLVYAETRRTVSPHVGIIEEFRTFPLFWISWAWVLFSTLNASAYLLAPVSLTPYITRRNAAWWGPAAVLACIAFFSTPVSDLTGTRRIISTFKAVISMDTDSIIAADKSASARIVPTIYGVKALLPPDMEIITGHGVDADKHDTPPRPGVVHRPDEGSAGLFGMLYDYGAPCAAFLWWAIGAAILVRRRWTTWVAFLLALQLSADYNMQLPWMVMAFSMTYKCRVRTDSRLLHAWRTDEKRRR